MSSFDAEVLKNFAEFQSQFYTSVLRSRENLRPEKAKFLLGYKRIALLNAWRQDVLSKCLDEATLSFVLEAQNDGITSLAFAGFGAWRVALQSLRGMIENMLLALYFSDHPVELKLWERSKYKIGAGALFEYFESHPKYEDVPQSIRSVTTLRAEYDTLSRAVHGRLTFRMTKAAESTVLLSSDAASVGGYFARQRETAKGLNLLLLCLFGEHLTGAKHREVRLLLSQTLPASSRSIIKQHYSVNLPTASPSS